MGVIIHRAVIVTTRDYNQPQYQNDYGPLVVMPDIGAFRAEMPMALRQLLVGPVLGLSNGFVSYFWAPCGAKSGSALDRDMAEWRQRFIELWEPRQDEMVCPYDVVEIEYGQDNTSDGVRAYVQEPYAWYTRDDNARKGN